MSSLRVVFLLGLGAIFLSLPLLAHHNAATVFDVSEEAEIELSGTVTRIEWLNPHIWIYVDVTDANGNVTNYAVAGGTPNSLRRRGWNRSDINIGDEVHLAGLAPSRDGSPRVHLGSITTANGRQLFSGRN